MSGPLFRDGLGDAGTAQAVARAGSRNWRQVATDAGVCLSLANLLFLNAADLLQAPSLQYFQKNAAVASLMAFYFNILLVGTASWGGLMLMRRVRSKFWQNVGRIIFLSIAFEGLNAARSAIHLPRLLPIESLNTHLLLRAAVLAVLGLS